MFWIFIGIIAATLSSIQLIPQTIKVFKTKSVKDISLITFVIIMFASFSWLLHGIHVNDIFIIVANSIAFISSSLIVISKFLFK